MMNMRSFGNDLTQVVLAGFLGLAAALGSPSAGAERYALLIGINDYQSEGVPDLDGPVFDVAALKRLLVERWQFAESHIVTLVNRQASRQRILQALRRLIDHTQSGDHVFLYFSGHGTSARARKHALSLPHTSGALIPADFPAYRPREAQLANVLIGRRDLRPLLTELDQGGRWVFAAFDSCYSGNAVRGLYRSLLPQPSLKTRYVPLTAPNRRSGSRGMREDPDLCGYRCGTRDQQPYPYRQVFFLSAASEDEVAVDIGDTGSQRSWPTLDGKPHGAFSDALLRVLAGQLNADTNHDGLITYGELQHRVRQFMLDRQYPHVPQRLPRHTEDRTGLAARSLFEYTPTSQGVMPGSPVDPTGQGGGEPLRVQLLDEDETLAALLGELPGVERVTEDPEVAIKHTGQDVLLLNGTGDLIVKLEAPSEQEVLARLRQEVWVKKLLRSEEGEAAFNLTLEMVDDTRGITVMEGEQVAFDIQVEKPAYLLLLNIDAQGRLNVLYPYDERELEPLPAGARVRIPGGGPKNMIQVTPPFGTDQLVAYGFERLPAGLRRLLGKQLDPGSPGVKELEQMLTQEAGQLARASFKLISVPREAPELK